MKYIILGIWVMTLSMKGFAQYMMVKDYNYNSFNNDSQKVTKLLEKLSSPQAKQHPEYGVNPFNSFCSNCIELTDKRTIDSRYFIDRDIPGKFYAEKSYFPLHYTTGPGNIWRTIDFRIKPQPGKTGVYTATNQPVPTKCDLNAHFSSLYIGGQEFKFNRRLSLYFLDKSGVRTGLQEGSYAKTSVGDEGLRVSDFWPGIDMEQTFRVDEIETNYIVHKPLQLPDSDGYMVIEDHFTLPKGWTIYEAGNGRKTVAGYFSGDYRISDGRGNVLRFKKPVYYDANAIGMQGYYNLKRSANECILQVMIPEKWLNMQGQTYPLYIDPSLVTDSISQGDSTEGEYSTQGSNYFAYGFTSQALGSCDYSLNVDVPGGSIISEAYTALEYQLTYSDSCGMPAEPAPYCTFSQVMQQVVSNICNQSVTLGCSSSQAPNTGTCTTDSLRTPYAHPINLVEVNPQFLSCITPQCNTYQLPFTLKNIDSICGDVCGYLCATGHMWSMIVAGYNLNAMLTATGYPNADTTYYACDGQKINFAVMAHYGLPPYHYYWTQNGGVSFDSTSGSQYQVTIGTSPQNIVYCKVVDSCGNFTFTQSDTFRLTSAPITVSGNSLTAPYSDGSYQWYLNDTLLTGDTLRTIIATQPGTYSVSYQDTTQCGNSLSYVTLGIGTVQMSGISVYPNPASGGWHLRVVNELMGNIILLYDALGQLVYQSVIENTNTEMKSMLASGIYQLNIIDKAGHSIYQQSLQKTN